MKKTLSRIIIFTVIASMLLAFAGCGEKKDPANDNITVSKSANVESLKADKIASFTGRTGASPYSGGLVYRDDENDRYGVISLDGQYDTGAQFVRCHNEDNYFQVTYKVPATNNDYDALNSSGIIDSEGNILVPFSYAFVYMLNERFAKVYTITEQIYSKDDAVLSFNGDYISTLHGDEDAYYNAKWEVYDTATNKLVPGVSSENADTVSANGNYLYCITDSNTSFTIDSNGTALEDAKLFDDGSYKIEKSEGTVYDKDNNKLFTYDLAGFIPERKVSTGYVASKYADGISTYVIMDTTGKVISAEFKEKSITVYDSMIFQDGKLYNYEGKQVVEGTYSSVTYDETFKNAWVLHNDNEYTFVNADGKVLFKDKSTDDLMISASDFGSYTNKDDTYYAYSYVDKDYTIKGMTFAPWIINSPTANGLSDIVDSTSGETLISGYSVYAETTVGNNCLYIYASKNGITDVYKVVKESEFVDVAKLKTDLLTDLTAAFNAAGISVSVDEATGELAMDSSVLFGGDSSALTDDGKALLDKFIKAYTSIIFSDKYKDFVKDTIVEGHTAPVAGSTYEDGLQLSVERAENVLNYCLAQDTGVDAQTLADSFTAVGYSNSKPVFDENGEVVMDACRRVSFRFIVDSE